jgi:hypothetical protein
MYYAQINNNGKVFALSDLASEVVQDDMIFINSEQYDERLLNTFYVNGEFIGFYLRLEVDKSSIMANGTDIATITATVRDWQDNITTDYADSVSFELNGQSQTVVPGNGIASITFSSTVAGEYVFNVSGNKYTNPNQIKVVVENADIVINGTHFEIKQTLDDVKKKYLVLIQEAQLLGDTEEVARLQGEYVAEKAKFE